MTEHVRLEPVKHIQIHLGGMLIVDTTRGYVVHEGSLPPRYYVPREFLTEVVLADKPGGKCPWKGDWRHLDVTAGGARVTNGAWTYFETTPVCERIRDYVAFYPEKVDRLVVE